MIHKNIINGMALLMQYLAYIYVFSRIKGDKISRKIILPFIVMELSRGLFLGGALSLAFLPVELYILDRKILKNKDKEKSFFYAIYTFYFVFTFFTFFDLAFQEFINKDLFNRNITTFWLIAFLMIIVLHRLIFHIIKLDTNPLKDDDPFVSLKIIKPLNKTLLIAVAVLLTVHYLEMYFDHGTVSQYSKYLIFAYLFMIVSVLILLNNKIVAYQEEIFQREKEEQYRRLQLYTNEIQTLYQTVRGFKHDYKNMLITLRDSIQTGDIENVRYLYQNILVSADISLSEGENIDDLSRLESPALKSLLYHKFNQARQEGVTIHLEIKDEVTGLQMELLDFVRILSILVDNAIEAAKETVKPEVFFAIVKQETRYIIHIKNSIKSGLIPVSQIFKQGYSSKGKERGEGLYTVSQIIKRYCKVAIETEITDLFFTQIVYIGDKS